MRLPTRASPPRPAGIWGHREARTRAGGHACPVSLSQPGTCGTCPAPGLAQPKSGVPGSARGSVHPCHTPGFKLGGVLSPGAPPGQEENRPQPGVPPEPKLRATVEVSRTKPGMRGPRGGGVGSGRPGAKELGNKEELELGSFPDPAGACPGGMGTHPHPAPLPRRPPDSAGGAAPNPPGLLGTLRPAWSHLWGSHPRDTPGTPKFFPKSGRERVVPSPAATEQPRGPPKSSSGDKKGTPTGTKPPWGPPPHPGDSSERLHPGLHHPRVPRAPGGSGEGTQRRRGGERSQPRGRAPGLPARRGRKPHPGPVSRARPRVPAAPRARSGRNRYRGGWGGDTPGHTGRAPGTGGRSRARSHLRPVAVLPVRISFPVPAPLPVPSPSITGARCPVPGGSPSLPAAPVPRSRGGNAGCRRRPRPFHG